MWVVIVTDLILDNSEKIVGMFNSHHEAQTWVDDVYGDEPTVDCAIRKVSSKDA
jgi:hypothetical protein